MTGVTGFAASGRAKSTQMNILFMAPERCPPEK